MYKSVCMEQDKEKVAKITAKIGVKISARDSQSTDSRTTLRAIMGQWFPLSRALMNVICDVIPPPLPMAPGRIDKLLYNVRSKEQLPVGVAVVEQALLGTGGVGSSTPAIEAVTVAYVSKMVAVDKVRGIRVSTSTHLLLRDCDCHGCSLSAFQIDFIFPFCNFWSSRRMAYFPAEGVCMFIMRECPVRCVPMLSGECVACPAALT